MKVQLAITSASYSAEDATLVRLIFNDSTRFSIYLEDGSPRNYAHDLLDAWLAAGNVIAEPAE